MSEDYASMDNTLKYYGKVENHKISRIFVEIPFLFQLTMGIRRSHTAHSYKQAVEHCIERVNSFAKGDKIHPNWIVSIYV